MKRRQASSDLPRNDGARGPSETKAAVGSASRTPTPSFRWSSPLGTLLAAGVIIVATMALYTYSFHGQFLFDDEDSIRGNATILRFWPIWNTFCPPNSGQTVAGRPLLNFTLAANYAISGFNVWSYHAVNLAIHILGALLLFGILRRTFLLPALGKRMGTGSEASYGSLEKSPGYAVPVPVFLAWADVATPLALVIALLWAVHPLQTESVTYIVQRAESLVGLFYLLTLYCTIRGAESVGLSRAAIWYVVAVVACLLGILSKEVIATAPVIVLLYDRTFLAGSFREAWRRRYGLYLALAGTWLLLGCLVIYAGNRGGTAGLGIAGPSSWAYLCTQFGAIVHYLRLSVWPYPLVLDYGEWTAQSIVEIVPYAIVVLLLGAATLLALWRWPKVGFLGAWFFAILAPTSSIVPVATQTIAEHRMYLPLAAVLAGVVVGAYLMGRWLVGRGAIGPQSLRTTGGFLVLIISLTFGVLTYLRNIQYSDGVLIWHDVVTRMPNNGRGHYNYGFALHNNNQFDEAIAEYREALRLRPEYFRAENNLGAALIVCGEAEEGIEHYRKALEINPQHVIVSYNLANALWGLRRFDEAQTYFQRTIELQPDEVDAYRNWAMLLATCSEASVRDGKKAIALCQKAEQYTGGRDWTVLDALAAAYAEDGRFPEAVKTVQRAIQLGIRGHFPPPLIDGLKEKLELYKAGRPFRQ